MNNEVHEIVQLSQNPTQCYLHLTVHPTYRSLMFNGLHAQASATHAELATQTLNEESAYRFPSFTANDAVTLGLSIRKRFRASSRHSSRGKGIVISIQTISGHTLFACTVGDLGGPTGMGDVSLDSWANVEGMINVVRRTGHSSFYVEKGMNAIGKTASEMGIRGDFNINGGAFPVWLQNAPCCPIAVIAAYGGSSAEDHRLVVTSVRDYLSKMSKAHEEGNPRESTEWVAQHASDAALLYVPTGGTFEPNEYGD